MYITASKQKEKGNGFNEIPNEIVITHTIPADNQYRVEKNWGEGEKTEYDSSSNRTVPYKK